jgi:hypothetical protein
MGQGNDRIDRLEDELSPPLLMSLWMSDLGRSDSPLDYFEQALSERKSYLESRGAHYKSTSPEYQLLKRAREQLKNARPGVSLDDTIVRSLKVLIFRRTLFETMNATVNKLLEDCRSHLDALGEIVEMLEFFYISATTRECHRPSPPSPGSDCSKDAGPPAEADDTFAGRVKFFATKAQRTACEIMVELRAAALAAETISANSFEGRNILFRSFARAMKEARHAARIYFEKLSSLQLADGSASEKLEEAAQNKSEVLLRKLVDYSHAVVALRFDEIDRARRVLKPHLPRDKAS